MDSITTRNEHHSPGRTLQAELRDRIGIIACLGMYWAWASSTFFGTTCVFTSSDPLLSSEIVHLAALVTCSLVTTLLPVIRNRKAFALFGSIRLSAACASAGTLLAPVCSLVSDGALALASAIAGIGEALMLYQLCRSIDPNSGDQIILAVFSLALVVSSVIYALVFVLSSHLAVLITAALPLAIAGVYRKFPSQEHHPSPNPLSAPDQQGKPDHSTLPWKVMVGFSVFGIAFGLMRGMSPDDETLFNYYYLSHELCKLLVGLVFFAAALRSDSKYWVISMAGASCFALSFLLTYNPNSEPLGTALNIAASAGYTCFELLMWMIIYELASETRLPFEKPYGVGRGLMQVGVAIGTLAALLIIGTTLNSVFVDIFQIVIVFMLVLILVFFNDHNIAMLWGIKKQSLSVPPSAEEKIGDHLVEAFSLSNREREVALFLMKGRSEPFIAESMGLSRSTVHSHVVRLYTKTGVHSRQELLSKIESISLDHDP